MRCLCEPQTGLVRHVARSEQNTQASVILDACIWLILILSIPHADTDRRRKMQKYSKKTCPVTQPRVAHPLLPIVCAAHGCWTPLLPRRWYNSCPDKVCIFHKEESIIPTLLLYRTKLCVLSRGEGGLVSKRLVCVPPSWAPRDVRVQIRVHSTLRHLPRDLFFEASVW